MNGGRALFSWTKPQRWTIERPETNFISRLQCLPVGDRFGVQKSSMPAAGIDDMELALLVNYGRMVARDKGMPQYQVAVLQPSYGEWRVTDVDLFLTQFIDQQQSSGWYGFGHEAPFACSS